MHNMSGHFLQARHYNILMLSQQIIKGSYTPLPSSCSKELRDLVDRLLTLSADKRPSVNDVLALPIMKARIAKFLGQTMQVSLGVDDPYCRADSALYCMSLLPPATQSPNKHDKQTYRVHDGTTTTTCHFVHR